MDSDITPTVVTSVQILFRVSGPIAAQLLPKLDLRDVDLAYRDLVRTFTRSNYSPDHISPSFNNQSLATLVRIHQTVHQWVDTHPSCTRTLADLPCTKRATSPPSSAPLRLGTWLCHHGVVAPSDVDNALQWQRRSRPLFGQIAMHRELLGAQEFAQVLRYASSQYPFGHIARSLNVLSEPDIALILKHQSASHCPIGRFFIDQGLVAQSQLSTHLAALHRFNHGASREPAARAI